ncbi:hypothetical protein [Pedobacter rhizosphaerae]|uniref:Plasmid transfer protein n=1 Tax=Pedobacter rhizosphaerae TaxID=390241 RepID=A0A1H9N550_9SPHI|nr:hypothetical protein [Pedobacter rhizosphaerae]SER30941.1 hypothetical protein SAMN04488023_10743 [Pedobacter rhizosphaerae]
MKTPVLFSLLFFLPVCLCAQINVALLHQLVSDSKREYNAQNIARDQQARSSGTSVMNASQMERLKSLYRTNQSQINMLGTALNVVQISAQGIPLIEEISSLQTQIFSLCAHQPLLVPLALSSQLSIADRAAQLLRYCYGITLSIGALNQMRQSDRAMLFSFVIAELRSISGSLKGLEMSIRGVMTRFGSNSVNFSNFSSRDKTLVDEIIFKIKQLKGRQR